MIDTHPQFILYPTPISVYGNIYNLKVAVYMESDANINQKGAPLMKRPRVNLRRRL
jgi:hypothetical protein